MGSEILFNIIFLMDLLTDNEKEILTDNEKEILAGLSGIFDNFYKRPTQENYNIIRAHDSLYFKGNGDSYQYYLLAIHDKWNLGNPNNIELSEYKQRLEYLLDPDTILNPKDLDFLWVLFYATGDMKYPNKILEVAEKKTRSTYATVGAAKWSYDSHKNTGRLP
jgi:hypothetical protein